MKLGVINYINVLPVYYNIFNGNVPLPDGWELVYDTPKQLVESFSKGNLDVSPVSSFSLSLLNDVIVFPDICIASKGRVLSVKLFSNEDLGKIREIYTTHESLSSVNMLKIILNKKGYNISRYIETTDLNKDVVLAIGDKALKMEGRYKYILDLGEEWYDIFHLPSVFAVWISRKSIQNGSIEKINNALKNSLKKSLNDMNEIIKYAQSKTGLEESLLEEYYKRLHYHLREDEKQSLRIFFEESYRLGLIDNIPHIKYL
ncbi:MAG: menaquinone biosynthetic enzyme MqnA/MqnD family protein [Thermoplasmata archaeon]